MARLTVSGIKIELEQRGLKNITKDVINHWAIVLLLERFLEIRKTNK